MKATIEVQDKHERDSIRVGIEDPCVRACAIVLGVLNGLNSRDRKQVIHFVMDRLATPDPGEPVTELPR